MEPDYLMNEIKKAKCNTLNLHEELGQVEYLFCDKTGTLTKNELVFRGIALPDGQQVTYDTKCFDFGGQNNEFKDVECLQDFYRCITLNHDCISVENEKSPNGLMYNGPSIDETCLLDMSISAKIIEFRERDAEAIRLKNHITNEQEEWEMLRTFEFTSERKAMSVIVRDKKTKRVFVHVKGADSSILPKVTHARGENALHKFTYQEELQQITDK